MQPHKTPPHTAPFPLPDRTTCARRLPVHDNPPAEPKFAPALSEDEAMTRAHLFKALADPTRLRILSLLNRYEGSVCVFEIVESFPLEQPTISHHLRILREAGLIACRKKGLWAYYYVRREALKQAQEYAARLQDA
jgi:ArsR family transcriptional regulator